jgi:hypothetical protein
MYGNDDKKPAKRMGSSSGKKATKPEYSSKEREESNKRATANFNKKIQFMGYAIGGNKKKLRGDTSEMSRQKTAKMEAVKRMLKAKKG